VTSCAKSCLSCTKRFVVVFMGSVGLWVGLGPGSKFSLWYGLSWVGLNKLNPRTTLN